MGGVSNPSTPATLTQVLSQGGSINIQPQFTTAAAEGSSVSISATVPSHIAGNALGNAFFSNNISGICRSALRQSALGDATFGATAAFPIISIGGGGAPNVPNAGGFTLQIYAGAGDAFFPANAPGYFIGLSSQLGAMPAGQLSGGGGAGGIPDCMGLILDSTAGGMASGWSWVSRRGTAAATIASLSGALAPALQQLFCVQFVWPPNSDAGIMSIKQLTGPGAWKSLLANQSLAGIGAAIGTRLTPVVMCRNFINSGNNQDVWLVRIVGSIDTGTVPPAF